MKHTIPAHLLQRRAIRVVVIGCGGNGSVIAMGLPYIHQALLLAGHPGGLDVTLIVCFRQACVTAVRGNC